MSTDPTRSIKKFLTFAEAATLLPRRRQGRKVAISTIWRWAKHGVDGVYLKVWAVGGSGLCTTAEALDEFFEQLSAAKGLRKRQRSAKTSDSADVDARLQRHGLLRPSDKSE